MTDEYTCQACGRTFNNGWTDADAEREAEQVFGVTGASKRPDMAVVCDDCYKAISDYFRQGIQRLRGAAGG